MVITTTETIVGKKVVKTLGLARGSTIRARNIGRDIQALFRNIVGGEIKEYQNLLNTSREEALSRMTADAQAMGANAIVCVRLATSQIASGAAEILAYGTAVIMEDVE